MRYVLTELRQALRRNVTMHIAVVLTLFVSLTLIGVGLLITEQSQKAIDQWGSQLQVTAFLCKADDDTPGCTGEVTGAQKKAIERVVGQNPEVESYHFESQQVAFEKVKQLLGPEKFEGPNPPMTAKDTRESIWITLKNPEQDEGIISELVGLDGVAQLRDMRQTLAPIYGAMDALWWGSIGTAAFLAVAALLLVGNTILLAVMARRREIAIMRLVGASSLYISVPFLLEALLLAAVGVVLAGGALAAFVEFGIEGQAAQGLAFMPWVGWPEYGRVMVWVAVAGPVLTLLPTFATLLVARKYTNR